MVLVQEESPVNYEKEFQVMQLRYQSHRDEAQLDRILRAVGRDSGQKEEPWVAGLGQVRRLWAALWSVQTVGTPHPVPTSAPRTSV